ncbi:SDR family oxidoreductase [Alphaproteobacteria bacterium]|nr:SDR family oxidoreductase [Alphaproteobacteria bacterium]
MSFGNKVAFVAGAGGGMGLTIANRLIESDCNVVMADLKAEPADIAGGPGGHVYFEGDLSEQTFVKDSVEAAVKAFGGVDYLVNTAGVLWLDRDKSVVEIDMDVWDRVLAINLKSFALTARYCVPEIRARGGGAMVHFSSIDATGGDAPAQDAYGVSKAAVIRLAKSLAIQFAEDGIRSNVILPGPTISPMQARWDNDTKAQARIAGSVPLGRLGTVDDMADACLFLLSDKARFITGVELPVDGGVLARV